MIVFLQCSACLDQTKLRLDMSNSNSMILLSAPLEHQPLCIYVSLLQCSICQTPILFGFRTGWRNVMSPNITVWYRGARLRRLEFGRMEWSLTITLLTNHFKFVPHDMVGRPFLKRPKSGGWCNLQCSAYLSSQAKLRLDMSNSNPMSAP